MTKKVLTQEMLKLIACITMLIDHFGAAIVPHLSVPNMVELYYACRVIGRLAFPVYCFLLCTGMGHTRNPYQYILRLGLGILLAEVPFDFLFEGGFTWAYQSVMVTLTLGAVMLLCIRRVEKTWTKLLMVLPFAVLAELAKCDYGGWGIVMIAIFSLFENRAAQAVALLLANGCMESAMLPVFGIPVSVQLFAIAAMVPICLYSGRKLTRSAAVQWGFYLFYPVHMVILWLVLGFVR